MAYFLLYQILPLAALWIAFTALGRMPAFGRWGVAVVFVAGSILQFAFWIHSRPDLENPDSLGFFRLGHGLETDLRAILFRPKLYPLFLGLVDSPDSRYAQHGLKAVAFWQCLLKLGMAGLLVRFARLSGWKPATTGFVLFLFLCNALWLREPLRIFDTTLFAFLFTAFLVLAAENLARFSAPKFAALCAAAGLTALTRQAADPALAVSVSIVLAVVGYRAATGTLEGGRKRREGGSDGVMRMFTPVVLSLLAGLAVAGSGALYNGVRYGVFQRSVALGINLYTHASYYQLGDPASPEWDFVERTLPGARSLYPSWETGYRNDMPWSANALPHALERGLGSTGAGAILAADGLLRKRSLDWAWENPGIYLASFANEGARLLLKCEDLYPASIMFSDPAAEAPPGMLLRIERGLIHQPLLLLLLAGLAALVLRRRSSMDDAMNLVCAVAAVAYLALVAAVQIGLTRYALPVYPVLLMLAGSAVDGIPSPRRGRSIEA